MEYEAAVIKCLTYIEKHLKGELTAEQISGYAGYSLYHCCRIFRSVMNKTMMEYVKERRLLKAWEEIRAGRRILEVAVDYGYETHSGFTKAFRRQYGYSPALLRALYYEEVCMSERGNERRGVSELNDELIRTVKENGLSCDLKRLGAAYEAGKKAYAGMERYSGEDYITHPLNVAILLADMGAPEEVIIAGLLHDVPEDRMAWETVRRALSPRNAELIRRSRCFDQECRDEEVIMICLADRLHNMRTIEYMPKERWEEKSRETMKIFVPLAAVCECEKWKKELELLAVKYL